MSEPPGELWVGLQGPIPIADQDDAARLRFREAGRIAQAAVTLDELTRLVCDSADPLVRVQAIPRLRARFPDEPRTEVALVEACRAHDVGVRFQAYSALADVQGGRAREVLRDGLEDDSPRVRLIVATALKELGDVRAPEDPEAWAYDPFAQRRRPNDDTSR
jgi:HEAT repeat protein